MAECGACQGSGAMLDDELRPMRVKDLPWPMRRRLKELGRGDTEVVPCPVCKGTGESK